MNEKEKKLKQLEALEAQLKRKKGDYATLARIIIALEKLELELPKTEVQELQELLFKALFKLEIESDVKVLEDYDAVNNIYGLWVKFKDKYYYLPILQGVDEKGSLVRPKITIQS